MKQIWQLCKSVILNLVHKIVQNFSIWCAFTCLMGQNSFFAAIQKLHFWKVPKMRLVSVHIFNGELCPFLNILRIPGILKTYLKVTTLSNKIYYKALWQSKFTVNTFNFMWNLFSGKKCLFKLQPSFTFGNQDAQCAL